MCSTIGVIVVGSELAILKALIHDVNWLILTKPCVKDAVECRAYPW